MDEEQGAFTDPSKSFTFHNSTITVGNVAYTAARTCSIVDVQVAACDCKLAEH